MTPKDESTLCEAILDAIADYDPSPEEADAVLEMAKGEWRMIHDNRAEEYWIDRQRFDTALAAKLRDLAAQDAAEARE